jgi:hypothetical protein
LLEVRRADAVVPADEATRPPVPSVLCVAPVDGYVGDRGVVAGDCHDLWVRGVVFRMEDE